MGLSDDGAGSVLEQDPELNDSGSGVWSCDASGCSCRFARRAARCRPARHRIAVGGAVRGEGWQARHRRPGRGGGAAARRSISTQAVYDVLAALTRAGLARRIEPAGSAARDETRVGDNHHHAVCRSCGAIIDVDCVVGEPRCVWPADTAASSSTRPRSLSGVFAQPARDHPNPTRRRAPDDR